MRALRAVLGSAPPLSRAGALVLVAMVAGGTAARLVWAFATFGVGFDIESHSLVRDALLGDLPGGPYDFDPVRWPYPGGFFVFTMLAEAGSSLIGGPFHGWIQVPAVVADALLALLVAHVLRAGGSGERTALLGAGAVALGPSFAVISGFHGQIDSVAILPAVLGLLAWQRDVGRRALWAGLLIGAGAAVKLPPGFAVFALLPTARSRREGVQLLAAAAVVPVLATAPWLLAAPGGVVDALRSNRGVVGFGGLSAFLQPDLPRFWSTFEGELRPSALVDGLTSVQNVIVAVAVLAVTPLLVRRRTAPLPGLVAIWLVVFAVNPNFAYQYLVWGLPFFLLAGHVRGAIGLQLAILPATVLLYGHPAGVDETGWLYFAAIQAVWVGLVAAAVFAIRSVSRTGPGPARPAR